MARHVLVVRPFPDIADHVVKAVAVRLEATDRRSAGIAILLGVVDRKDALPAIGDRLTIFIEGIAPILIAVMTAARGKFPLRLGAVEAPHWKKLRRKSDEAFYTPHDSTEIRMAN